VTVWGLGLAGLFAGFPRSCRPVPPRGRGQAGAPGAGAAVRPRARTN